MVLESEISVLTHCEHSYIALTYGSCHQFSFDKYHEENKNY